MCKQKGLSLIELMIAIALGMILMLGVIQMFLSSRQVFSTQQAMSRIQETGRLAMEFMARDIRMAGYMGCMTRTNGAEIINTLNSSTAFDTNFGVGIQGYSAATVPSGIFSPAPVTETDVVVMRGASGEGAQISDTNTSAQLFITQSSYDATGCADGTPRVSGICQKDVVVVADCAKARVFQVSNIQTTGSGGTTANVVHSGAAMSPGNALTSWGGASAPDNEKFEAGAEVMTASSTAYFVAVNPASLLGMPSLYQRSNQLNMELLEGVERMSLTYGVDTDDDFIPNEYRTAAQVTAAANWGEVRSVRIELLVASLERDILAEPQPYTFAGDEVEADDPLVADRRLRMVFTNTIGIRSRLP